jgi:small subunit ribosomal protein S16
MDEPKEGATTMKKKAQEKLAAKANPAPVIEEAVVSEVVAEAPAEVVAEVSEPTVTDVVVEVPAEVATTDVVVETEEAAAE